MFLAAVAKPRLDSLTGKYFDGKIGIWPLIQEVPAKRASKNRPRGTPIKAPITVTRNVYRDIVVNSVIPMIKEKWPEGSSKTISIQHDNASAHDIRHHPDVIAAGCSDGWYISIVNQPPKSSDLNALDLGYFNSIQSLQYQKQAQNIDDLVSAVEASFEELTSDKLENTFMTLRSVMKAIIEHKGDNDFKIPHASKAKKRRQGFFVEPEVVTISSVEEATEVLANMYERLHDEGSIDEICDLFNDVGISEEIEYYEF
ncbi:hypothetical protein LEN26_009373 [Aphanomyces euteiches]|nr:hypothetical protein LEN26_009373 [Aphanomyces euteiches]